MQDYYNHRNEERAATGLIYLRPEQIRTAAIAPKEGQDRNAIIRISESMRRYGVLQPLSVRLTTDMAGFPAYELVDGARRLRAARLLGIDKLPCVVVSEGERSAAIDSIVRELRQKGVHFFDQAAAFRRLGENFGLTQEEIARKVGVSQSAVANKLRLLRLSPSEQHRIREAGLTERHARALLRIKNAESREAVLAEILRERMTVGHAEALIDAFLAEKSAKTEVQADVSRETTREVRLAAGENVSRGTICGAGIGVAVATSGGSRDVSRETTLTAAAGRVAAGGMGAGEVSRGTFGSAGESDSSDETRIGINTAIVSRETMPFFAENGSSVSGERTVLAEASAFSGFTMDSMQQISGSAAGSAAQASGITTGSVPQVSDIATGSVPQVLGVATGSVPQVSGAATGNMPQASGVVAGNVPQFSGGAAGGVRQISGGAADITPFATTVMAEKIPPQGICPRKFALRDLRPLYNSIERTLSIFRKTGQEVECRRIESETGVTIIIEIPRHA